MTDGNFDYRRKHERKIFKSDIVFVFKNRSYTGTIKNISLGGAFVATPSVNQFSIGDIITITIPFTSREKHVIRRGRIVWQNNEGFAIEFV